MSAIEFSGVSAIGLNELELVRTRKTNAPFTQIDGYLVMHESIDSINDILALICHYCQVSQAFEEKMISDKILIYSKSSGQWLKFKITDGEYLKLLRGEKSNSEA